MRFETCARYQTILCQMNLSECTSLALFQLKMHPKEMINSILKRVGHLKTLHLTESTSVTDDTVNAIVSYCPHLTDISLRGCKKLSEQAIDHVIESYASQLIKLDLGELGSQDWQWRELVQKPSPATRFGLSLNSAMKLAERGVNLIKLNVRDCTRLDLAFYELLADRAEKLEALCIEGCLQSVEVFQILTPLLEELTELHIGSPYNEDHLDQQALLIVRDNCRNLHTLRIVERGEPRRALLIGDFLLHLPNAHQLTDLALCGVLKGTKFKKLAHLHRYCPQLTRLDLRNNGYIDLTPLQDPAFLPLLTELHVTGLNPWLATLWKRRLLLNITALERGRGKEVVHVTCNFHDETFILVALTFLILKNLRDFVLLVPKFRSVLIASMSSGGGVVSAVWNHPMFNECLYDVLNWVWSWMIPCYIYFKKIMRG